MFSVKTEIHKCLLSLHSVVHLGPGEERSEDAVMMNTPVIKSALEMGFERSLVKQTVQSKILTSGENYRTVQELVSDLLSAEDQKREEEREMLAEAMASGGVDIDTVLTPLIYGNVKSNRFRCSVAVKFIIFPFLSDGFTFVKRHQAALIQRLKSVEPLFEHLRDQNVLSMYIFQPSYLNKHNFCLHIRSWLNNK